MTAISRRPAIISSVALLLGMALLVGVVLSRGSRTIGTEPDQPNFLLIITDDQRYDQQPYMPYTNSRIFDEGINFTNAVVTTPRCCPSRSSIFTGMYARHHGVLDNFMPLEVPTIVPLLQEAGYYTGQVGKYLNSYPTRYEDPPAPGFDYWIGMFSAPCCALYYDPELSINQERVRVKGYQTYILRDFSIDFIRMAAEKDQPFFLVYAPYAPHRPAVAGPGDEGLYDQSIFPDLPSFNEADISDKPLRIQEEYAAFLTEEEQEEVRQIYVDQVITLHAVDIAVNDILDELDRQGMLDDTVVIFLSDNGRFSGEHRNFGGKQLPYEESIHVPFAIRYPWRISPTVESRMVGNIDIAPTLLDLAGLPIPDFVDGQSLVPLFEGTDEWRDGIIIESWPRREGDYRGLRTERYVYIEWLKHEAFEFYDLEVDPYQLENRIDDPEYAVIIADLRQQLNDLYD